MRSRQLRNRLIELEREQVEVKRKLDALELKRQQQAVRGNVQKQLLEQIPIVHQAMRTPNFVPIDASPLDIEAAKFLDGPPSAQPTAAAFNTTSYEHFKMLRSNRAQSREQELLQKRFADCNANPIDNVLDVSDIHNRELITPLFKDFMLRHIAPHSVNDKAHFKYCSNKQWHTLPLSAIYDKLMSDLDSVGFELEDGADFDASDSNRDVTVNIV
jgi:hypothetical protein